MTFRIGITRDLLTRSGEPCFDPRALDVLEGVDGLTWEWVPEDFAVLPPEVAARYDGLHLNLPKVTAESVGRQDCRLKIIARNGVGYDSVDVAACTAKGIAVTNTPVAVRRPVAVATLTLIFALAGRLFAKDRLVRAGRWNDRTDFMGQGLTSRTLGLVGAGSIGQEIMRLARPFFGAMIAADPFVAASAVEPLGARLVPLDQVLSEADFVVVCCLLTKETHHLIDARALSLMKHSAYFINVGRGPIHDEAALVDALRAGAIAGAGLDVTEVEPISPSSPLIAMDNVILTPHALCWTDECFRDIAETALRSLVSVARGERPVHVVNTNIYATARKS
ncbi:MAG TPA: NAD(P)-dependent oxidoreductase [Hyphomicrobiaceae bacterium]|nr:NAD(P)-dependent oxidoreductase [Hyphomicrobiaceae bacterium]